MQAIHFWKNDLKVIPCMPVLNEYFLNALVSRMLHMQFG